jgi:antitoxin ParD1/3/4
VIREALRDWRVRRRLGELWDEGIASGVGKENEPIETILRDPRREHDES